MVGREDRTMAKMPKVMWLKIRATSSARDRGHVLGKWTNLDYHRHSARCTNCDKEVVVNTHPQPNQIDIGGEAVALGCDG